MAEKIMGGAVRIVEVEVFFTTERPLGVFAFGGSIAGDLTLCYIRVKVADRKGRSANGWGAIFLSHPWAFPGAKPDGATKDRLMREIVVALSVRLEGSDIWGHPLDHFLAVEPELATLAARIAVEQGVSVGVPQLCALVCLSPIDAAVHDAYGNLHDVNTYEALGAENIGWDLGRVLGPTFSGRFLSDVVRSEPAAFVPIAHTVGAVDPLTDADAGDGPIPSLGTWVHRDGVSAFKVKLRGKDLHWDIGRIVNVYCIANERMVTGKAVHLFADLNEQGPSVDYLLELLAGIKERSMGAFTALEGLEQPTPRNLTPSSSSFHHISSIKPIVLDEGLTSLATIDQALLFGWNGIALKTCKCQSLMLLALAKATALGLQVSVQDLSNPSIALLQSIGFASRLPDLRPLEANARQYFPATSTPEALVYPNIYKVRNGRVPAGGLTGPGLGYGIDQIDRPIFQRQQR